MEVVPLSPSGFHHQIRSALPKRMVSTTIPRWADLSSSCYQRHFGGALVSKLGASTNCAALAGRQISIFTSQCRVVMEYETFVAAPTELGLSPKDMR